MGKHSMVDVPAPHSHVQRDAAGNQLPTGGDSSAAATASREIFQGLFKDLGKQAMAMESILRLVCGKVDKLEHWVTEMSFGMTELDLKLRNIAHNIEGTASNVDDVSPVNRWSVPQDDQTLDAKAATVIKKVGVGLHKKKQMRMTGMVAGILDQLTTVAETPTAVESESESHHDKRKSRRISKKAGIGGATSLTAMSTATTPRGADSKEKTKPHKKKTLRHNHEETGEEPPRVVNAKPTDTIESVVAPAELKAAPDSHIGSQLEHEELASFVTNMNNDQQNAETEQPVLARSSPPKDHVNENSFHDTDRVDKSEIQQAARDTVVLVELMAADVAPHMTPTPQDDAIAAPPTARESHNVDVPTSAEPGVILADDGDARAAAALCESSPVTGVVPSAIKSGVPMSDASISAALTSAEDDARANPPNAVVEPAQPSAEPTPRAQADQILEATTTSTSGETIHELRPLESAFHQQSKAPPAAENAVDVSPPSTSQQLNQVSVEQTQQTTTKAPSVRADFPLDPADRQPSLHPLCEPVSAVDDGSPVEETPLAPSRACLAKPTSTKLRNEAEIPVSEEAPPKRSSRQGSIRKTIMQRQPSLKKKPSQRHPQALAVTPPPPEKPEANTKKLQSKAAEADTVEAPRVASPSPQLVQDTPVASTRPANAPTGQQVENDNDDDGESDDNDDSDDDGDDDDSSEFSSGSDESIVDLDDHPASSAAASAAGGESSAADKKMSVKMTRTLTALNKLKKANVLTPEEIAELKVRANAKWFKLRDHVKEKNKKDVANILLKRKKNIFTVSNRIELLEEKSREVYASIKQLTTELKSKVMVSTLEGLRRRVHDIHSSLQVLDDKISKGNTPAMDHIKQLAKETEAMRMTLLEQLQLAREHCDASHHETLALFEQEWKRVANVEVNIHDKLAVLVTEFDDKLRGLPNYTDALEGIRRAVKKKADLKLLKDLEARLLGPDAESEDCLVRCLSCHKEVIHPIHESHAADDIESSAAGSPHFKRVNPGTASARVYRSNVPLNAQPIGVSESSPELCVQLSQDEVAASTTPVGASKSQPRRQIRNDDSKPSPLSFIHVTATRAMAADGSRPISAPVKKKAPPK